MTDPAAVGALPRDTQSLCDQLSLVYLTIDALNAECARRAAAGKLPQASHNLLTVFWPRIPSTTEQLARCSDTGRLFLECGVCPPMDPRVLDRVLAVLLDPSHAQARRLDRNAKLPPLPGREVLKKSIFASEHPWGAGFISFDHHRGAVDHASLRARYASVAMMDEFLDPMAVVRNYLRATHGFKETVVGHYLQQWIVRTFRIPSHMDFRLALASVCDRLHGLFYGVHRPTRQDLRSQRGATVSTNLLVREMAECLTDPHTSSALPSTAEDALPTAVGLYLVMRLRRLLRYRYHFLEDGLGAEVRLARVAAPAPGVGNGAETVVAPVEWSESRDLLARASHQRQCVDMLRPLEYSFLLAAVVGIHSSMDGLNFIFRGGILPREGTGRSLVLSGTAGAGKTLFALQFLCDLAAKGGLSVYFSFEEDYDSIVNRLVTFDFLQTADYEIVEVQGPDHDWQWNVPEGGGKGVLLLYRYERDQTFSIPEVLRRLGGWARDRFPLQAAAIDSVNALHFDPADARHAEEHFREAMNELVEAIDTSNFFGLLLSEKDDRRLGVIPYLVDTVIELETGTGSESRTLEIKKCRSQNFQRGPHPLHFSERKGIIIHPSLGAVRSALRSRIRATLSEKRGIPLPPRIGEALGLPHVREKGSVLISGASGSGKTLLALQLLSEASRPYVEPRMVDEPNGRGGEPPHRGELSTRPERPARTTWPSGVLVVTFRTSEVHFSQMLRQHNALYTRWERIRSHELRWYSPGSSISGARILNEIRKFIARGRRVGMPVERILFDEVDLAEQLLPSLRRDPLFWPTVLELVNTEALTSMFVVGDGRQLPPSVAILEAEVDYTFHLARSEEPVQVELPDSDHPAEPARARHLIEVRRVPHLAPFNTGKPVAFSLDDQGLIP